MHFEALPRLFHLWVQFRMDQAFDQGFGGKGDLMAAWEVAPSLTGWEGDYSKPEEIPWWVRPLQGINSKLEKEAIRAEDLDPMLEPPLPLPEISPGSSIFGAEKEEEEEEEEIPLIKIGKL